ncbi:NAD(P)/FAD-dependent oxidoreductase [Crassaminicella thermophila]|uniref:NAD(P)/FAD-dependent oxidoreductase n=1 Tax=Crassaminicella thermophila TaxID=2599308 RepID=A0A5C0SCH7_CRATE|nr:NAD(P)/FAD-dependent oxidoreductase [Crassaminicella thermophila]QEK11647.1 NAD(P)/FAD-dependent oxidoreductase [Crassaminicella thermophila]
MMKAPKYAVLQKIREGKRTYGITPRIPGGFIKPDQLMHIAQVAKKYNGIIKITSGQRISILGLKPEDVDKAWKDLDMEPGVLSPYSVKNVEMCPASFCKRAKQNSLKLGMRLEKRFYGASTPNRTKIGVVGCRNSCTSAYSKDIAVIGDVEGYIVTVGGSAGFYPRMPDVVAEKLSEDEAYYMVEAIYEYYTREAEMGEKLGHFIDRIHFEKFKEGVEEIFKEKI